MGTTCISIFIVMNGPPDGRVGTTWQGWNDEIFRSKNLVFQKSSIEDFWHSSKSDVNGQVAAVADDNELPAAFDHVKLALTCFFEQLCATDLAHYILDRTPDNAAG